MFVVYRPKHNLDNPPMFVVCRPANLNLIRIVHGCPSPTDQRHLIRIAHGCPSSADNRHLIRIVHRCSSSADQENLIRIEHGCPGIWLTTRGMSVVHRPATPSCNPDSPRMSLDLIARTSVFNDVRWQWQGDYRSQSGPFISIISRLVNQYVYSAGTKIQFP